VRDAQHWYVMPSIKRSTVYKDADTKANWLDSMATLDARLPETRGLARRFAMGRFADPNELGALAREFHRFVRSCIRYVRDPAGEEFTDSDQILLRGFGDCDDKARLFVALCRSVGIAARTRPCFIGDDFVHVQAEVLLTPSNHEGACCFREDPSCSWCVSELIVKGLELGDAPPRHGRVLV
jgi:transglutaminase-like putative cysteine protease